MTWENEPEKNILIVFSHSDDARNISAQKKFRNVLAKLSAFYYWSLLPEIIFLVLRIHKQNTAVLLLLRL